MDRAEFVVALYDAIWNAGLRGEVPVQFDDADGEILPDRWPSKPWHWTVLGDRTVWFLRICDDRDPTRGRSYQLEATRNFFPWALELGLTTSEWIPEFLQRLMTAMEAQALGQPEAVADPEWSARGELLNPWADRVAFDDKPSDVRCEITEEQFLGALYDALTARHREGRAPWNVGGSAAMPSRDKLHPSSPRFQDDWHWELYGTRAHWWLAIVDPRYPGPEYPYRIDPKGDPGFFATAETLNLLDDIETFIEVGLITPMDERDLGQSQAQAAYDQGKTASDPPWVRMKQG